MHLYAKCRSHLGPNETLFTRNARYSHGHLSPYTIKNKHTTTFNQINTPATFFRRSFQQVENGTI